MREHGGASDLGLDKRLKGGAADLYGASALVDRAPRCQVTIASAEAGTAASFKADHEGEAVACRTPYMQVLDETADAVECSSADLTLFAPEWPQRRLVV